MESPVNDSRSTAASSIDLSGIDFTAEQSELTEMALRLLDNLRDIGMRIQIIWANMMMVLLESGDRVSEYLMEKSAVERQEFLSEYINSTELHTGDFALSTSVYASRTNKNTAK